jgi:hypothetical protein
LGLVFFLSHFVILCLLIGTLRPLIISVRIERFWVFHQSCNYHVYSPFFTFCLFFVYWPACSKGFILSCSILFYFKFFFCKCPLKIFCSGGSIDVYSFNFWLLWKILISSSIRKDNFAGYTSLGWPFFSFRVWNMSFYDFHLELMLGNLCLPLYVTCLLQLLVFFLCSVCWVFWLWYI